MMRLLLLGISVLLAASCSPAETANEGATPDMPPTAEVSTRLPGFEGENAIGEEDGSIRVDRWTDYSSSTKGVRVRKGAHKGRVTALLRPPGTDVLISAGADGAIRSWRVPAIEPLGFLCEGGPAIRVLELSPDGAVLRATRVDGTVVKIRMGGSGDGTNPK
jgi:hypothetical protein